MTYKTASLAVFLTLIGSLAHAGPDRTPDLTIVESFEPHQIQLLDTPSLMLERMLGAISSANEDIVLEYNNVFVCNWIGGVLFTAIQDRIRKVESTGKRLRVRLLLDYGHYRQTAPGVTDFGFSEIIRVFQRHGIELKLFNPFRSYSPIKYLHLNLRDHQKRLIVDGKELVMGGRLIGNQYFGKDDEYDRLEKDIWISGPIVRSAQDYFEALWRSPISFDGFAPSPAGFDGLVGDDRREVEWTEKCLGPWPMTRAERETTHEFSLKEQRLRPKQNAGHLLMGFDYPGYFSKRSSFIPYFYKILKQAKKSILLEEQYFLPTASLSDVFDSLSKNSVSVEVLTNGLGSGDDPDIDYMTSLNAIAFNRIPHVQVSFFQGKIVPGAFGIWRRELDGVQWQIHSKALVIDGQSSWIGSNNLDSRSETFSLETGVLIVDQREFAHQLTDSIRAEFRGKLATDAQLELEPEIQKLKMTPFLGRLKISLRRLGYRILEVLI